MIDSGKMRHFRRFQILNCWPDTLPLDRKDLNGTARQLLEIVSKNKERRADSWPASPQIIKGAALELAIAQSDAGEPLGRQVIELLVWAASLPNSFLDSAINFFEGKPTGGRPSNHPWAYDLAQMCDWTRKIKGLPVMPDNQLQTKLAELLDGSAPSRATIRAWRKDPEYREAVDFEHDPRDVAILEFYLNEAPRDENDEA